MTIESEEERLARKHSDADDGYRALYEQLVAKVEELESTVREEAAEVFEHAIEGELHHASDNGHYLTGQGVGPGEIVPGVRASSIEAALEGARRRLGLPVDTNGTGTANGAPTLIRRFSARFRRQDPKPWVSEAGVRTAAQAWDLEHGFSEYRPRCPIHGTTDCSPQRNGCSRLTDLGAPDA